MKTKNKFLTSFFCMAAALCLVFTSNAAIIIAPLSSSGTLTANTPAVVQAIAVPYNSMVKLRVDAIGSIGGGGILPATIAITNGYLMTNMSHGVYSGTPVNIACLTNTTIGAMPTGLTNSMTYYANSNNLNSIALYDTMAHAVSGGATGLIPFTTVGTNVVIQPATLNAIYQIDVAAKNVNGVPALIGSASSVVFEDISAWNLVPVANPTNQCVDLVFTGDATFATRYSVKTTVTPYSSQ